MKNCEYWIWLGRTLGAGARIDDLINYYGSARDIYEAGVNEWRLSGIFTSSQITKLGQFSPSESYKIIKDCENNHWDIITPDDVEYPLSLREISNPPAVLYADGDSDVLIDNVHIAMVGTRKASQYGVRAAGVIASALANAGFTVVSGGALGIDSASHSGAMYAGGKTVCILGCGFGTSYLRENEALRHEISRNGVILTEYPPFAEVTRYTFPQRNRIISGMSVGTVVIEAGERSGSLITARLAAEQGRDVFAVPGDVFSSSFTGANRLIHNGAKPVFTAKDIVEEYYYTYPDKIKIEGSDISLSELLYKTNLNFVAQTPPKEKKPYRDKTAKIPQPAVEAKREPKAVPDTASENAKKIFECIEGDTALDDIITKTGLGIGKVLSGITELEMLDLVETLPGNKYKKSN